MSEFYGDATNVKTLTGIQAEDFRLADDDALVEWIEARLVEITGLIDRDRNWEGLDHDEIHGWLADHGWRVAIDGIANRWCAEHIRFAMAHRDSPIVKVDDFQVEVPGDIVPGKGILADLRRFPRKADEADKRSRFIFSMSRANVDRWGEDDD